jgi:hypothetical protein
VIEDLRSGRLKPPTEEELRKLAALFGAPSDAAPSAAPTRRPGRTRPPVRR